MAVVAATTSWQYPSRYAGSRPAHKTQIHPSQSNVSSTDAALRHAPHKGEFPMKRTTSGALLLLVLLICAGPADATQVIYQSPQQMGTESALVVRGRVTGIHSYWNESQTKIFTETVIAVDETYKGSGAPTVRVVQPGGVVGNRRMQPCGF